jgi:hypothetical protein
LGKEEEGSPITCFGKKVTAEWAGSSRWNFPKVLLSTPVEYSGS